MLKSMRHENETMLKESEGRNTAALRLLIGNITTEIIAVNVILTTHTASITSIETRLAAIEHESATWPTPSGLKGRRRGLLPADNTAR